MQCLHFIMMSLSTYFIAYIVVDQVTKFKLNTMQRLERRQKFSTDQIITHGDNTVLRSLQFSAV